MHTQQFDVGIEAPVSVPVNSEHFSSNNDDIVRDLGQPYLTHAANCTRRPPNHFGEWAQIKDTNPSLIYGLQEIESIVLGILIKQDIFFILSIVLAMIIVIQYQLQQIPMFSYIQHLMQIRKLKLISHTKRWWVA
jgi:hypothetical protein